MTDYFTLSLVLLLSLVLFVAVAPFLLFVLYSVLYRFFGNPTAETEAQQTNASLTASKADPSFEVKQVAR